VLIAPATAGRVRDEVEASGTVEPLVASVVAAEVEGDVRQMPVREGSVVGKGDPLAVLSTEERRLRLAIAQARLDSAEAALALVLAGERDETKETARLGVVELERRLEIARDAATRAETLSGGDRPVLDPARAEDLRREAAAAEARLGAARQTLARLLKGARPEEIAQARAEVARATAERDVADLDIRRCTVAAPFSGRVVRLRTEVGQWVVQGGPIADLQDSGTVLVTVGVGERDIPRVGQGAPATVRVDAWPGREFQGTVDRIVPAADVATRAFSVRIAVANPSESPSTETLRVGMYAQARIGVGEERDALLVPADAIVSDAQGVAVFVIEAGKARRLAVRRGVARPEGVEVAGEGLAVGTMVITSGNEVGMTGPLRDGDPVIPAGGPGAEPGGPDARHGAGGAAPVPAGRAPGAGAAK
jgi:RND family efflux transporter MFP subunit